MAYNPPPGRAVKDYKKGYQKEDEYEAEDKQDFAPRAKDTEELYKLDVARKIRETVHLGAPRLEDEKIQPLKLVSSKVIGTIFDRVEFLKDRIDEIESNVTLRTKLHGEISAEIDVDIGEKESLMTMVSDVNEKRNFKVDISVLRKEKRHEAVQFWKDVIELRSELRELNEQYEIENKIGALFNDIKNKSDNGDAK
jgi:hypothetical protein